MDGCMGAWMDGWTDGWMPYVVSLSRLFFDPEYLFFVPLNNFNVLLFLRCTYGNVSFHRLASFAYQLLILIFPSFPNFSFPTNLFF